MSTDNQLRDEPCFVISVAARIVLYSMADIDRLRRLKALTEDMGLNLAGAEVAIKLMDRIEELEGEVKQLTEAVNILKRHAQQQAPRTTNRPSRA